MIHVTKTFLPPQREYNEILKKSWDKGWITNRGGLVLDLEETIKNRFDTSNLFATTNGTLPIQIAIKALNLKDEIITTPFSYVATLSSIVWENCKPVFVDIHPEFLTIDETKIEAAITNKTSGIIATHVFGNPCNIEAIERLAKKYNLKTIYDAAHCFAVKYKDESIFKYGDVSTCSFHATKVFHTGEGGAIFANDDILLKKLFYHHNFGHDGPLDFFGLGINAKMSEMQAAMGLAVLPYFDSILQSRKAIIDVYNSLLDKKIKRLKLRKQVKWNYSYYPVILDSEKQVLKVCEVLQSKNIYPRRYFYPSLNNLPYVDKILMPNSDSIASRILCLPLYHDLPLCKVEEISMEINKIIC